MHQQHDWGAVMEAAAAVGLLPARRLRVFTCRIAPDAPATSMLPPLALADVEKYVGPRTSAVIVEPVQGEGGVFPADKGFLKAVRQLASAAGALMIVDEVQCGLGRTGRLWAHEAYDVAPDMMTLAKPLAGGLPIGAVMVTDAVASAIVAGDHGTTYGGNPFVTRVAHAVFNRIADPAFLAESRRKGGRMLAGLEAIKARHPAVIAAVRGTLDGGLFAGVELKTAPKAATKAALDRGLIVITAGDNVLRICPPLNIPDSDIDFGLKTLEEALVEAYGVNGAKLATAK